MFFTNIARWTRQRLAVVSTLFNLLYLGLTLVGPLSIICWQYDIFKNVDAGRKLTGVGIITVLIILILGLRSFKRVVNKLPDNRLEQQRLKYTLLFLYAMAFPFIGLMCLVCFKSDFMLAYNTFKWCLGFIIGGLIVDYFFIKYLDREKEIRHAAEFDQAKDDRRANGVI